VALHDAASGTEQWHQRFRSNDVSVALHRDGSVSIGMVEGVSISFDSEDFEFTLVRVGPRGTVAGRYAPGLQGDNGPYDVVALGDGRTLFLHAGHATVLDSGAAPLWSAEVATPLGKHADRVGIAEPAVAPSGDILLAGERGAVGCLDSAGRVRWVVDVMPDASLLDPMVDARGVWYVCAGDGTVAALGPEGSVRFRLATDTEPLALSMAGDGLAVLVTREGEVLFIG
jgi:hypothetical protein